MQWTKGQSGNPRGRPKRGMAFTDALRAKGTPKELADIAWKAARKGEPWAIQMIYQRLEPVLAQMKLTHEVKDARFDFSKLTDAELTAVERILERAANSPPQLESGASQASVS